jgi:hypothetical protein
MFSSDYTIDGLDSMSLEVTVSGSMHFIRNLGTNWYKIEGITLSEGNAILNFMPRDDVKTLLKSPCRVTIPADEAFSLVVKEQCGTRDRTTIKYIFLNCRTNEAGEPYFHCEILQKSVNGRILTGGVRAGTTSEHLIREGFQKIKSIDDKTCSSNSVILENHRKAS